MLDNMNNNKNTDNINSVSFEEEDILINEEMVYVNYNYSANYIVINLITKKFYKYKERASNKYLKNAI